MSTARSPIDRVPDPDRIEAVAGAVIECESAETFIARAKAVAES